MENTLCVARTLYDMYMDHFHQPMDEMKMHKLMYLSQRESLMYRREKLFEEDFYGWRYGPVLKSVRTEYLKGSLFSCVQKKVTDDTVELLRNVLERYGDMTSWKLSCLSHQELSWKKARSGLRADDNGDQKLCLDAMMLDAARELAARKNMATT